MVRVAMLWVLYNIVFTVGYLLMMPYFLMRMWRRGGYRKGFLQRLAVYPESLRHELSSRRRIWMHAVSVGEMFVALRVMHAMRSRKDDIAFVVTTTTSTGHAVAAQRLAKEDVLLYFPADFPWIVSRVLKMIDPVALILTECEIWPNLMRQAHARNVPVMLYNGRISDSSYRGYRYAKCILRPVLEPVALCLMQTEADRMRILSLGASEARAHAFGTVKYDMSSAENVQMGTARDILDKASFNNGCPILLGGSTWPGEEKILLDIFTHLKQEHNALKLILVPRHAERATDIEKEILARKLPYVRRSRVDVQGSCPDNKPEVMLVDTTGELIGFYACATVIFVGKSLTEHGGQNFIEPASLGKAVVVGPHLENFPLVAEEFRAADAFVQVRDASGLEQALKRFFGDEEKRTEYAARAESLVRSRQGTVARIAGAMEHVLWEDSA